MEGKQGPGWFHATSCKHGKISSCCIVGNPMIMCHSLKSNYHVTLSEIQLSSCSVRSPMIMWHCCTVPSNPMIFLRCWKFNDHVELLEVQLSCCPVHGCKLIFLTDETTKFPVSRFCFLAGIAA